MTQPKHTSAAPRTSTRAQRLVAAAREAGAVRAYQTDPDVVALRVERVRAWSSRLIWVGIILGLAFTMTNVQQFAAQGAPFGSPAWVTAWLLDPMVSLVLVGILLAEQVTARYQVPMGRWPRIAKWGALAATYTMNTWQAWAAGNVAHIVLHSVPPLMVFVAVEAFPVVRDRLTEAVMVAERDARRRAGAAPDPAVTVDTDVAADGARAAGEVAQPGGATSGRNLATSTAGGAQPGGATSGRNLVARGGATFTAKGAQPGGATRGRNLVARGGATFTAKGAQPAGRNRTRNPQGATQVMRNHWDAELAQGRIPSGGELARVGGVSGQYARKLRADWIAGDVAQPSGRNQGATTPGGDRNHDPQPAGATKAGAVAQPQGATSRDRVAQPQGATSGREVAQPDGTPDGAKVAQPDDVAPSVNGQRRSAE